MYLLFLPCDACHCWGQVVDLHASHMKFGSRRGQVVLPTRDAPFAACKEQFM